MEIENINQIGRKIYENGTDLTIYEISETAEEIQLSENIKLKIPRVDFTNTSVKKYVILRDNRLPADKAGTFRHNKLYSVDFAYGEIDFERLNRDDNYRKLMMKYVFSRAGLDGTVKTHCGMLPIDIETINNPDGSVRRNYLYLGGMSNVVIDKVLKSAYRERVKIEKSESEENEVELPDNPIERFHVIAGKNAKRKKKSFWQGWKNINAEHKKKVTKMMEEEDRRRRREAGEIVPEPIDYAENVDLESLENDMAAVFFKTGIVITKNKVGDEFKTEVYPRYSMIYWNKDKRELSDTITAIFSEVDDEELAKKGEYRKKFVNKVFLNIFTSLESMRKTYSIYYRCSLAIYRCF